MVRRMVAGLVLSLAIATTSAADPVTLTSGTIETNDDYIGSFSLSGSAFAADGSGIGVPIVSRFGVGSVDFSGGFSVFAVNDTNEGRITVGGDTFRGFTLASFQVAADPFVVPTTDRGPQRFNTPFRARGVVQLSDSPRGRDVRFSQDVTGSGMLWFIADNIGDGVFRTRRMGLTFSQAESPSPTPEPGSLMLIGTGLGALWWSRRFRSARG